MSLFCHPHAVYEAIDVDFFEQERHVLFIYYIFMASCTYNLDGLKITNVYPKLQWRSNITGHSGKKHSFNCKWPLCFRVWARLCVWWWWCCIFTSGRRLTCFRGQTVQKAFQLDSMVDISLNEPRPAECKTIVISG